MLDITRLENHEDHDEDSKDPSGRIRQLILQIAQLLVEEKQAVTVKVKSGEQGKTVVLTVAPNDLSRIIGKHGLTVRSLRTLLQAATRKYDRTYTLEVVTTPTK
jgi:predicted RNA-binding protein YlqC (UPF0109 family)